jgi:hypothetical protein
LLKISGSWSICRTNPLLSFYYNNQKPDLLSVLWYFGLQKAFNGSMIKSECDSWLHGFDRLGISTGELSQHSKKCIFNTLTHQSRCRKIQYWVLISESRFLLWQKNDNTLVLSRKKQYESRFLLWQKNDINEIVRFHYWNIFRCRVTAFHQFFIKYSNRSTFNHLQVIGQYSSSTSPVSDHSIETNEFLALCFANKLSPSSCPSHIRGKAKSKWRHRNSEWFLWLAVQKMPLGRVHPSEQTSHNIVISHGAWHREVIQGLGLSPQVHCIKGTNKRNIQPWSG